MAKGFVTDFLRLELRKALSALTAFSLLLGVLEPPTHMPMGKRCLPRVSGSCYRKIPWRK